MTFSHFIDLDNPVKKWDGRGRDLCLQFVGGEQKSVTVQKGSEIDQNLAKENEDHVQIVAKKDIGALARGE